MSIEFVVLVFSLAFHSFFFLMSLDHFLSSPVRHTLSLPGLPHLPHNNDESTEQLHGRPPLLNFGENNSSTLETPPFSPSITAFLASFDTPESTPLAPNAMTPTPASRKRVADESDHVQYARKQARTLNLKAPEEDELTALAEVRTYSCGILLLILSFFPVSRCPPGRYLSCQQDSELWSTT